MNIEAKIKENVLMSKYTTFRIGGSAKFFVEIESKQELEDIIVWCRDKGEEMVVLGGGSNILVNDAGVDGVVVKISNKDIVFKGTRVECGAGANLIFVATKSFGQGLSGLEWATGIPGGIGGAIRGNAGAFGSEIKDIVETIEVFDLTLGRFDTYSKNTSKFDYRTSIFKQRKNLLIWSVTLKLQNGLRSDTDALIEQYTQYRQGAQPKLPSAGSIFKNISWSDLDNVNSELASLARDQDIVRNGMIGAGWIIDKLDVRGKKIGGAKVSLEHANFIVNAGEATASDVVMLISFIKQQVRDEYGVQLQEEVQYVGF